MIIELTLVCVLAGGATFEPPAGWEVVKLHASDPKALPGFCYAVPDGCERARLEAIGETTVTLQRKFKKGEVVELPTTCSRTIVKTTTSTTLPARR